MQKREKSKDSPSLSALPDVLIAKIVEELNDKEVRALASTNKEWNRPMLQCLGSAVGGQSTFDKSQCTGRAYYHPDTVRATLLCALPAARSLPVSRRVKPVQPLHLYVNKDLIDTFDKDSRVRCFVDAGLPLRVTLLYPLDVDVNKPESMTEQASGKPKYLPTVAGVRPTRALVVGTGSESGFIIKDSKPCEYHGCTKLAEFRYPNGGNSDANVDEIKLLKSTLRDLDRKDRLFRPLLSVYFIRNIVKICAPAMPLHKDLLAFMTNFRKEFNASFLIPKRLDVSPFHPDKCRVITERCDFATKLFKRSDEVLQRRLSIHTLKRDVAELDLNELREELTTLLDRAPVTDHDLPDRERGRYCAEHREPGMIHVDDNSMPFGQYLQEFIEFQPSDNVIAERRNWTDLYKYGTDAANHSIGYVFMATRYLETVRFHIEPKNILSSAFLSSNIVELPLMPKLEEIHQQAFYASIYLDTLGEMPLLREIGFCAFDGCPSLKHLPSTLNNLEKIEAGAFRGCTSLQTLPKMPKLTHIHDQAFRDCIELEKIHLSGSIIHIGNRVFDNCPKLEVTFEPDVFFDKLVCNDLKVRNAFQEAGLPLPQHDENLEGMDDEDANYMDEWTYWPYHLSQVSGIS